MDKYDTGIYIGYRKRGPFVHTLKIIPSVLRLGIGCRKGISKEQIAAAAEKIFSDNDIDERAVKGVYSIDLKADEQGLLEFCAENGWPLTTYTARELKCVEGDFASSSFVESVTGVDNVCERAAAMGGTLIVRKRSLDGVTCALAEEPVIIKF